MWSGQKPHDNHPQGSIAEGKLARLAKVISPMKVVGKAILIDSADQGISAAGDKFTKSFATLKTTR
jgi:hypothetical protein